MLSGALQTTNENNIKLDCLFPIDSFFNYEGCGVLKVDTNGDITMISGLTHTEPKSYIGQLCFICQ